ncbi:transcriptional regulator, TraR/DksA family [Cribrihabitans marinus]|uniref:Transcriptional regulator, TraR/DksA family n=1 Tax=Cribrihabitans marinus TaxID=1227549 RepID=A0A1H6VBU7_9RHOB|nr:TraR/DksA C4-type zinc finger protein [Cribrihabitans marinus]GGH25991.1 molecular chaperone DnaK [Cribrihabitans marinus]SEJ02053.1 transcriptional regulator, TraR/DksA family [Cribrihabitans marinus]
MNETEIARFEQRIRARLEQIDTEDRLGAGGQAVVQLDQQSVGRLSRMDALQNQAMAKAQQARRDAQRRRLEGALRRIEAGEYGWCDGCGEDLPPARLELDPAAALCVSCASG